MDDCQLVCYPRSGTCSLRESVCCAPVTFFPFKYLLQITSNDHNYKVLLPLNRQF